mmetsp:Transcript_110667/g.308348  ORF Transcript_110667/g.308348 Transcript_110667/m.308348 type:complete len:201 (-) Transcript_110667:1125-1727(-)
MLLISSSSMLVNLFSGQFLPFTFIIFGPKPRLCGSFNDMEPLVVDSVLMSCSCMFAASRSICKSPTSARVSARASARTCSVCCSEFCFIPSIWSRNSLSSSVISLCFSRDCASCSRRSTTFSISLAGTSTVAVSPDFSILFFTTFFSSLLAASSCSFKQFTCSLCVACMVCKLRRSTSRSAAAFLLCTLTVISCCSRTAV